MEKLYLYVTYELKPGARDAYLAALQAAQIDTLTRREAGCVLYQYLADPADENTLYLNEIWESEAAQAAHYHTPHVQKLGQIKKDFVENTKIVKVLGREI